MNHCDCISSPLIFVGSLTATKKATLCPADINLGINLL